MRVISKKPFIEASKKYPNQKNAIFDLYDNLKKRKFNNPEEMKKFFPSLDNFKYKKKWWVLDISGNHLRLICFIGFEEKKLYIKFIGSHDEYNKICKKYREGILK